MSKGSLAMPLHVFVILKLPWKPGGLSKMEGLEMEVTMAEVLLEVGLCVNSDVAIDASGRRLVGWRLMSDIKVSSVFVRVEISES